MRYEIHINGEVLEGNDLESLKRIGKESLHYYEIFICYKSLSSEKVSSFTKMNIQDMREANRLCERGYSKIFVAKKFHVPVEYLRKAIHQYHSI